MAIVYQTNKKTGVVYVYESVSYWDKDKQQSRAKRTCIGKLDPVTKELIPNKNKEEAEKEEAPKKGPKPTEISRRSFVGGTHLLSEIGDSLGLTADLKRCFPDSYQAILSLAYYLVLEGGQSLSRYQKWPGTHVQPLANPLTSQRISELFQSISEDDKQRFFSLQAKRRLEHEFLVYDTTSISSYSKTLKQVKYGKNKEHDVMAQLNLALVFGEDSRLPIFYRKLPGNLSDVSKIQHLLKEVELLNIKKANLVMDRGFYSEKNINDLFKHHHKFLIGTKLSLKLVKPSLDKNRSTMLDRSNFNSKYGSYTVSQTIDWAHSEVAKRSGTVKHETRRAYLHLYYDDSRATEDRMGFNLLLDQLEYELQHKQRTKSHESLYAKYFTVNETPVKGVVVTPNQEAINQGQQNFGYSSLLSNGVKDLSEALGIYRNKDVIEKAFGNLKERLNMRRLNVSSEESLDGKLFVQFIALIYLSSIKKVMNDHDLFKTFTLQELLDELDIIEQHQ